MCANLPKPVRAGLVMDRKRNGDGIGKFRHRLSAALENCGLIGIDAFEPVEKVTRAHSALDAKAHAIWKRAIGFEKHAPIVAPNIFRLFMFSIGFALLRRSRRNGKQEKQQRKSNQLVTNNLHAK